jgi:hypothetical protein
MSEELESNFSGFMPMIDSISITEATSMLSTEGDLIKAHTVNITTRGGENYVFSIDPVDLMRLAFLVFKVAGQS